MQKILMKAFGQPKGLLGALGGRIMARTGTEKNVWGISLLDVRPGDQVLEIGFGPGVAIAILAEKVGGGRVVGIDPSDVMLRQAMERNAEAIHSGRVLLELGEVSALPYRDDSFDKVISVNNIQMWPDPIENLKGVRRVLRPGGRIVIVLQPIWLKAENDRLAVAHGLAAFLSQAGFRDVNLAMKELKPVPAMAVSGVK